jgi:hypothetical protein
VHASFSLSQRANAWREVLARPTRFARHSGLIVLLLGSALLARYGTTWTRAGAVAGVFVVVSAVLFTWWREKRSRVDTGRLVRQVIWRTDRALGERALRIAQLLQRGPDRGARRTAAGNTAGGHEELNAQQRTLASFQLDKLIEKASLDSVRGAARRRARAYRWLGAACALVALAVGVGRLREVVEGVDVLLAREGRAPWPLFWTERMRVLAQPPAYLRAPPRQLFAGATSMLPRGTQLTLRARPLYDDRQLVVSDGRREAPFVSDGEGGLVAHYEVEDNSTLVVAARFGGVLISEPDALRILSLADAAPVVSLDGAPASMQLSDLSRLELRWWARDDHGLHQVDLVLRSGNREERRTLGTFDDQSGEQSGGHVLLSSDAFLRSLFLPAEVTIEARDNDPVGGSKWGKSPAFTLVPSAVGEQDARRYLALIRARDRFVDALAVASEDVPKSERARVKERDQRLAEKLEAARSGLTQTLAESFGGLRVPAGLRAFVLGRLRRLQDRGPLEQRQDSLEVLISELDGVLMSLSQRDAQRVAIILGNVAEEAMVGAQQAQAGEKPEPGLERLDKAIYALREGARQLLSLGVLGNDLGSVALADLGRVVRGRERGDLYHAELAARHLADRLHRPNPSFGASSSGGVEAGQGGSSEPKQSPSGAEQEFDELMGQIGNLASQHGKAIDQVDQSLAAAEAEADPAGLRQEAAQRAKELREAVQNLPEPGSSPGTPEAAAALARENAKAMAHDLESLQLEEAAEDARRTLAALGEAQSKAQGQSYFQGELERARAQVEEQQRWVQQQLETKRKAARERAKTALEQHSALEEKLAGMAAELARQGDQRSSPLPGEVTDRLRQAEQLMRQAAGQLQRGEGKAGSELQREAQRLLDQADSTRPEEQGEGGEEGRREEGRGAAFGGEVPAAEEQNRAEAFRKRVLRNLGDSPAGRLSPAVKRYAEGLLR